MACHTSEIVTEDGTLMHQVSHLAEVFSFSLEFVERVRPGYVESRTLMVAGAIVRGIFVPEE